mmetsp:Transcript_7627/g.19686  ORF Transcript_7627/g.19686 Transcript_7627/m.19686 type:complete len:418 (+) Transcript_7627:2079-3332(+)
MSALKSAVEYVSPKLLLLPDVATAAAASSIVASTEASSAGAELVVASIPSSDIVSANRFPESDRRCRACDAGPLPLLPALTVGARRSELGPESSARARRPPSERPSTNSDLVELIDLFSGPEDGLTRSSSLVGLSASDELSPLTMSCNVGAGASPHSGGSDLSARGVIPPSVDPMRGPSGLPGGCSWGSNPVGGAALSVVMPARRDSRVRTTSSSAYISTRSSGRGCDELSSNTRCRSMIRSRMLSAVSRSYAITRIFMSLSSVVCETCASRSLCCDARCLNSGRGTRGISSSSSAPETVAVNRAIDAFSASISSSSRLLVCRASRRVRIPDGPGDVWPAVTVASSKTESCSRCSRTYNASYRLLSSARERSADLTRGDMTDTGELAAGPPSTALSFARRYVTSFLRRSTICPNSTM